MEEEPVTENGEVEELQEDLLPVNGNYEDESEDIGSGLDEPGTWSLAVNEPIEFEDLLDDREGYEAMEEAEYWVEGKN